MAILNRDTVTQAALPVGSVAVVEITAVDHPGNTTIKTLQHALMSH